MAENKQSKLLEVRGLTMDFGGLRAIAISDTYMGVILLVMGGLVTWFALDRIDWDFSGIPAERLTLWGAPDSDIPWSTLLTGMVFAHIFYWGTNMLIAQRVLAGFVERPVVFVAQQENVLRAFAEGGDARVVHAQPLLAQQPGQVGQQPGAVAADQAHRGAPCIGRVA